MSKPQTLIHQMTQSNKRKRRATGDPRGVLALVVFVHETDLWYLKCLEPGFRHCFLVINDGQQWIAIDPMAHQFMIDALPLANDFDLAEYFGGEGHLVVETQLRRAPHRPAPLMPFTCVETIKRVLGIHDWSIITPYQLYRFLTNGAR